MTENEINAIATALVVSQPLCTTAAWDGWIRTRDAIFDTCPVEVIARFNVIRREQREAA